MISRLADCTTVGRELLEFFSGVEGGYWFDHTDRLDPGFQHDLGAEFQGDDALRVSGDLDGPVVRFDGDRVALCGGVRCLLRITAGGQGEAEGEGACAEDKSAAGGFLLHS